MALDDLRFHVRPGVPEPDGIIVGGTGNDVLGGREGNAGDFFGVAVEGEISLRIIDIPEVNIIIAARGSDVLAG